MSEQPGFFRQFVIRAVVMLSMTYVLEIGGTYNGVLEVRLKVGSLALLAVGVIVWLVAYIRHPLKTRPWSPLGPAIVLWIVALALSTASHPSGRTSIGLWYAGFYLGVWLILSDLRQRGLPGRCMTDGALLAAIPIMLIAIVQVLPWYLDWYGLPDIDTDVAFVPARPSSVMGNPNAIGIVLAVLIPFAFVYVRSAKRRLDQILIGIWILCALGTLYLTFSRGAWLGLAAGLVAQVGLTLYRLGRLKPSMWAAWWAVRPNRARAGIFLLSLIVLVVLFAMAMLALESFDTPRRGTSARLAFYEIASKEFRAHPLTGTGLFTFGLSILENRSIPPEQPHAHAHNLILNVASELGIPGLIALVITLVLIIKQGRRLLLSSTSDPAYITACCASLVAFGVHSLFDMPMMIPGIMLLMLSVLSAGFVQPENGITTQNDIRWRGAAAVVPPVLWAVLLITGWWSSQRYTDYVRGEQLLVDGDYHQGAVVLRDVAEQHSSIALYHAAYAYAAGLAAYADDMSFLPSGIDAYRRALELEPPHAAWWANLAVLYWESGASSQAIDAMQQATRYAPDDPDMWLNMGMLYEGQGLIEQARDAYHRVIELEPRWAYSHYWELTDLRREIVVERPVEPLPYQRAEALWAEGQYDAALAVLIATIDHDPAQPGPYTQIARLYVFAGDLGRAEDYLQAARLLAHVDVDLAWIYYVESEIARQRGDYALWEQRLAEARRLVLPDTTGRALFYGRDIAQYQFLRLTIQGTLLPQLTVLWPDPVLLDLLL